MKRKDFLKKFAVGGSILFVTPVVFNACADKEEEEPEDENGGNNPNEIIIDLSLAEFAELSAVGGYAYKADIIILRTSDTGYTALSKLCTHSQCTVTYNHSTGMLPCPCHGSTFTTGGAVTNGPANSNLKKYTVVKEGNTLKIT